MNPPPEAVAAMDDGGTQASIRTEIARLEDHIETLARSIERCRKLSLAARSAIAAGAIWLALALTGVVYMNPTGLFASLTAMIGGVVLLGSNATTWSQTEAALATAQIKRTEFIERIALRAVGDIRPTLH